jgi:hypothetical protein
MRVEYKQRDGGYAKMDGKLTISGHEVTQEDIGVAQYIVSTYRAFSRNELAKTLCYCQGWVTRRDMPMLDLGTKVLEHLEKAGELVLPPKREQYTAGGRVAMKPITLSERTDPIEEIVGELSEFDAIKVEPIFGKAEITLWKEYIERYHPEKYAKPMGSNLRYFIKCGDKVLGCILFSAAAWALEDRDNWIGWGQEDRSLRLTYVLNNSRFLLFPWVKVRNLASCALGQAVRRIQGDWLEHYLYAPVLLETFIDSAHYRGTSYRAANWQKIGVTKGRGRQDRQHEGLSTPREIYAYPLDKDFRAYLLGDKPPITREEVTV